MQEVSGKKDALISRISVIVDNLIQNDNLFQKLDKAEVIQLLSTLVEENLSTKQLSAIDDDELTLRIDRVMAIEVMSGLLDDLTLEQREIFEAAVEGR